jgi:hypothetical protein
MNEVSVFVEALCFNWYLNWSPLGLAVIFAEVHSLIIVILSETKTEVEVNYVLVALIE